MTGKTRSNKEFSNLSKLILSVAPWKNGAHSVLPYGACITFLLTVEETYDD